MRAIVATAAACGVFALTGLALGAASFTDTTDDTNAAPDITSIAVSEAPDGLVTLVVRVGNYPALPLDSWIDVWFDDDSNQNTGFGGDETLTRYSSNGSVELYEFDGLVMVRRPLFAGIAGSFADGTLTLTVPKAVVGGDSAFGVLAIGVRRQLLIVNQFFSSDLAPDRGRMQYAGPAPATLTDNGNDEDAAPDITGVRVTDTKDGWIGFAISTPNFARLTNETALWVALDTDNRSATGDVDSAVELQIPVVGGNAALERWNPNNGGWVTDSTPGVVRLRNSGNVVTVEVRRSTLGSTRRFGFSVTTAAFDGGSGAVRALDQAPDNGGFYRYALANRTFTLVATRISARPSAPRAGQAFVVRLPVRRSDTNRGITSGSVTCTAKLEGKRLTGRGSVATGAGRCSFAIPTNAAGARLQGRISVRVADASVAAGFAYVVR
jgi:hypothetical protein